MSDTPPVTVLTDGERETLLYALRSPGWATSLDQIGDGTDAIRHLRDYDKDAPKEMDKYVFGACRTAFQHAIGKAMFGPHESIIPLAEKLGLRRAKREEKKPS